MTEMDRGSRRGNFPFRKRSMPSKTVEAFPARDKSWVIGTTAEETMAVSSTGNSKKVSMKHVLSRSCGMFGIFVLE